MRLPSIRGRLGFFLYIQGRNDRVWESLRDEDKQLVLEANLLHNNERPDYADPELYQGGRDFDSNEDRQVDIIGARLHTFLAKTEPHSVIEIGPGSGFFTRSLAQYPTVQSLVLIDIVDAFLKFLDQRLAQIKTQKPSFEHTILHGDFQTMEIEPADAIVLLSTVHHIPNRVDLFRWIHATLTPGGRCFVSEPTHYWPRRISLLRKFTGDYHRASHRAKTENYSTHHFCTLEEFQAAAQQIPGLSIESYVFYRMDFPKFARKPINRLLTALGFPSDANGSIYVENRRSPLRYFSQRMIIEFRRDM